MQVDINSQQYMGWKRKQTSEGLVEEKHVNTYYALHVRQMSYMCDVIEPLVNLGRHCFGHLTGTEKGFLTLPHSKG